MNKETQRSLKFSLILSSAMLSAALLLCSCGKAAPDMPEEAGSTEAEIIVEESPEEPVEISTLLESMSLRQKVGQLFMIRPDALDFSLSQEQIDNPNLPGVYELSQELSDNLLQYPAGGIILFGKNISSPQQVTELNAQLQSAASLPLFIGTDEEGGIVARIAGNPAFDVPVFSSAADVGSSGDPQDAYNMGSAIGGYLKEYGFNMDFAPVADVNTNPMNPIIGIRSFSGIPETAADMAEAMAGGLKEQGIIPVFKHFPGHGDTLEDSHSGIAATAKGKDQLYSCEWLPFMRAGAGDCIMTGHIAVPNITGDLTPASMSSLMISDILKGELGFEGLVITDSMVMRAITDSYPVGDAAIAAFNAGCDIILMPYDYKSSFDAFVAAVEDGTVSEDELNSRVYRILSFKRAHNIL